MNIAHKQYANLMLEKGFVLHKGDQDGFNNGREDVYTHPALKYNVYIGPVVPNGDTVLHTGSRNAAVLDEFEPHSSTFVSETNGHEIYLWESAAVQRLLQRLILG